MSTDKSAMIGIWSKSSGILSNRENELGEPNELGKILNDLFSTPLNALRVSILGLYYDKDPDNVIAFNTVEEFVEKADTDFMYLYDGLGWFMASKTSPEFKELKLLC